MTGYDVVAIVVILLGGLIGFVRGGVRVFVTLIALVVAGLISAVLLPYSGPVFRKMIHPDLLGTVAAYIGVGFVVFLLVHALGAMIRARLHQSDHLGGVDRTVGLGFGMVLALFWLGVFHLFFAAVTPPERMPQWFKGATLYPLSVASAKTIQVFLPKAAKVADGVAPKVEQSVRRGADVDAAPPVARRAAPTAPHSPAKKPPASKSAYDNRARNDMDALVEQSR